MKLNKKELHSALKRISQTVPQKAIVPILENARFKTVDGKLYVSGNNLSTVSTAFVCETKEKIDTCIPFIPLYNLVGRIKSDEVELKIGDKVVIRADSGEFVLPKEDAKDFPDPGGIERLSGFTVDAEELLSAISYVKGITGDPVTKPGLAVVRLEMEGKLRVMASDGFQAGRVTIHAKGEGAVSIPVESAGDIIAAIGSYDGEISIEIGENHCRMIIGENSVMARISDLEFPDVNGVMDFEKVGYFITKADELSDAIKSVSAVTTLRGGDNQYRAIKIAITDIEESELEIEAANDDGVMGGKMKIMIAEATDKFSFYYNPDYVLNAMNKRKGAVEVMMRPGGPMKFICDNAEFLVMNIMI